MNIAWNDVENLLLRKGASKNEMNAQRLIFNNDVFQTLLLSEFGIITEKAFFQIDPGEEFSKSVGTLDDLGALDTYELIDFIEQHNITYKQASSITPQQMALIGDNQVKKVTSALVAGLDDLDPIRYSLSAIVQTGFPYKRLQGQQHLERKNGDLTVTMSAPNDIGLPSGIYPRLAFVHICSETIKKQDRYINLGPSLKRFVVDELGRPWTTGKKGTATKWKETMISLLATSFTSSFKVKDEDKNIEGLRLENVTIANKATLWWDQSYDDLKGAEIEVSEAFAEVLLKHATPLDVDALKTLSNLRSPLAFDLYCWLTYRYWKMEDSNNSIVRISWGQLYEQMGTSISTVRHFVRETRVALNEVKKVYPQANFDMDNDKYLILVSSPPHISPKRVPKQQNLSLEGSDTEG